MSLNSSQKYGIRLNTTFEKLIIVNFSTGLKGIINLKFEYWRQNRIAERD